MMPGPVPATSVPLVSVLMGVYNVAPYVREAIDSILNQTFTDFEFLIYNDGSTDDTAAIIRSYSDPRIYFVDNKINRSVSPNLNEGIELARGRYIVRMDGDDVAYPERIARQVAYMEANPDTGVCGTAVRYFGASNAIIQLLQTDEAMQQTIWLQNVFYQPSVIIRASVLKEYNLRYDTAYEAAEDYKLWAEMSAVTKLHNLSEVLLDYRIHPHQISRRKNERQQNVTRLIRLEQMARRNIVVPPELEQAFVALTSADKWQILQPADYAGIAKLLDSFAVQANRNQYSTDLVCGILSEQWSHVLGAAVHYRPVMLPFVWMLPFSKYRPLSVTLKLVIKCLMYWRLKPNSIATDS